MNTQRVTNIIKSEFIRRCELNESYSIRAYAKYLNVDHSLLTKLMRGQRELSENMAFKISERLGYTQSKIKELLETDTESEEISEDVFMVMADWFHFAIIELMKTENFRSEPKKIANTLDITELEATMALERLERLGFINNQDGTYILSKPNNNWFDHGKTSEARKILQKQLLRKALVSIDDTDFNERINSSLTVAISKEHLPLFRENIHKFVSETDSLAEAHGSKDHVYQLCVAFYPLTKDMT